MRAAIARLRTKAVLRLKPSILLRHVEHGSAIEAKTMAACVDHATQNAENPHQLALMRVSILVVEYSRLANTHPAGVRRTVLKLPLNEEYGGHPRTCSNHLTG